MIVSEVDRGAVWNENQALHFRQTGTTFVTVDADGVSATLSAAVTGTEPVALPYSFNTQGLVADGKFYLYSVATGFDEVTDPDLGSPIDCVWVDGYYFFTDGDYLYHTDLADETAIDPLKFATSEFSPDPTIGVGLTTDNKVIAFNRYTTEYFINQANAQFAFTRLPSRNVNAGIVATHGKVQINGVWYCCGNSKGSALTIYRLDTGGITDLANRQIGKILQQYTDSDLANMVMESRQVDNYQYLIVHLPNETLLYNFTIGQAAGNDMAWSYLASDTNQLATIPYRGINGVYDPRRAQWVYGDRYTAELSYLDMSVATHLGDIAQCAIYTPFIYLETASIDELEIDTIPGFTSTDDADVFLSLTYDGVTYGTEATVAYGAPSAYTQRFIARRLGYIDRKFGMKFGWASRSRMAFATSTLRAS